MAAALSIFLHFIKYFNSTDLLDSTVCLNHVKKKGRLWCPESEFN